jgi:hypothetical protein
VPIAVTALVLRPLCAAYDDSGLPSATHAAVPPRTFATSEKPRTRFKRTHACAERAPLAHTTASGPLAAPSAPDLARADSSSSGALTAPGMCLRSACARQRCNHVAKTRNTLPALRFAAPACVLRR